MLGGVDMGRADEVKQGIGCLVWALGMLAAIWAFAEAQQRTGLMLLAVSGVGILIALQVM
jgi:hypothetical protein